MEHYTAAPSEPPPSNQISISGQWKTAGRDGNEIWTLSYTLNDSGGFDGIMTRYEMAAVYDSSYNPWSDDNWQEMPEKTFTSSGTYTFDGKNLILSYEDGSSETVFVQKPEGFDDSFIQLNDNMYMLNGDFLNLEVLCASLGVDYAVYAQDPPIDDNSFSDSMPPYDQDAIFGRWETARREGNEIWIQYYMLNPEGTFYRGETGYMNTAYDPWPGEDGWYVMPMGFPGSDGTYTFDGQTLVLYYYADEYYGQEEETVTVSVQNLDQANGSVEFDGTLYLLFSDEFQGDLLELESLCGRLGIDYSADP